MTSSEARPSERDWERGLERDHLWPRGGRRRGPRGAAGPAMALAVSLLVCQAVAATQEAEGKPAVELRPTLAEGPFTVGDLLTYTVHLPAAPDERIVGPRGDADFGEWEVRDYDEERLADGIRVTYQLAAFETGTLEVPPIELNIADAGGNTRTVKTAGVEAAVQSVLEEGDEQPADIVGPLSLREEPLAIALRVLAVILAAAAVAAALWWLWRRRKRRVAEHRSRPDPPHVAALKALDALKASRMPEDGKIKAYYSELSEILRAYLACRYGVRTLEETTGQIVRALRAHSQAAPHALQFGDILREADLVKFAKARPDIPGCRGALESAVELVRETAPAGAPAVTESDDG